MQQLQPAVRTIWGIRYLIQMVVLSIAFFSVEAYLGANTDVQLGVPFPFISAFLGFLLLIRTLVWPPLLYSAWSFEVRDADLFVQRGVLTRVATMVPFPRIQHLDVSQSLLERMFGLSTLVVYTAGTAGAAVVIPGLPLDYANQLRDYLKEFASEGWA